VTALISDMRVTLRIAAALLVAGVVASCSASPSSESSATPFKVKVLVVTMFDGETKPWLAHEKLGRSITVPTMDKPMHCGADGLCVATIGEGKANAAISMSAILADNQLDVTTAYVLTAGVAGIRPESGTLGDSNWADWVVDYEIGGHHIAESTDRSVGCGYEKGEDEGTTAFHLDPTLVGMAYELTKNLPLADNAEAESNRAHYAGQAGRKPHVTRCDTVTADDFWIGRDASETAAYVMGQWTNNAGRYCTTQQEDNATAAVLAAHGYLNRYLSLRTASDFDQPYPGQSAHDMLTHFPGIDIAVSNSYTVASAVAHHLAHVS